MNREQTIEMATLMLDKARFPAGVVVECRDPSGDWDVSVCPQWDFVNFEYRRKPRQLEMWVWWNPNQAPAPWRIFHAHDTKEECVAANIDAAGFPINLANETLSGNRKPKQKEVWGFRGKDGFDYWGLFHSKEAAIVEYKDKLGDVVRFVEADPQ